MVRLLGVTSWRLCHDRKLEGTHMSKGMDRKKETKKKPAKTTKEKQAEKKEKKAQK